MIVLDDAPLRYRFADLQVFRFALGKDSAIALCVQLCLGKEKNKVGARTSGAHPTNLIKSGGLWQMYRGWSVYLLFEYNRFPGERSLR